MSRDLLLPQRIRAKGVEAIVVAGFETRGRDGGGFPEFDPEGALHHHTAGGSLGTNPSFNTVLNGRPADDLPGPLAQTLQTREPDLLDKALCIASGKANHGGVGHWLDMSGNYRSYGLEVEHTGFGPVHPARLECSCRILAAMAEGCDHPDLRYICQHFEYAPDRKVDFRELAPLTPDLIRARVGYWIGRKTSRPVDVGDPFGPADGPEPPPIADLTPAYLLTIL